MMDVPASTRSPSADASSGSVGVDIEFGRTADRLLAAHLGDLAFAMVPGRNGFLLASAWRIRRPLDQLKRDDFHSHHGAVAGEAAFRARMCEQAEHSRELKALARSVMRVACSTPWGPSQHAECYGEGVVSHSTAGHGGFHLDPGRNSRVHPLLRADDGFYEEDCAWAAVAQAFPELFTAYENRLAEETLRNWYPAAWEAIHGRVLEPGQSREKDRLAFERRHAGDWIVTSAITSRHRPGFVEVIATPGGQRGCCGHDGQHGGNADGERRYLIPSGEYCAGPFSFVIDEARYQPYAGPSSFIGWRGRAEP